jgi:1-acyl-sn-glycerol-3-phosphate acyltransferase
MQLPGPPVVPLLGNALLISNHQSEIYWPVCLNK